MWLKECALITGASSGLGRALSLELAQRGCSLVLVARNQERLKQCKKEVEDFGVHCEIATFDLQNIHKIPELYEMIKSNTDITPTILINNAGYNPAGFIFNTPLKTFEACINVNALSALAFIQSAMADMIKLNKGWIVNIMSTAMYQSFPAMSAYFSSKAALNAIHESLRLETKGFNIHTLMVDPGPFKSNYWQNLTAASNIEGYSFQPKTIQKDPKDVANIIICAMENGKERLYLSGLKDRVGYILKLFFPRILDQLIMRMNTKLMNYRDVIIKKSKHS